MLKIYTVKDVLDGLKQRLDENNELVTQSTNGSCYTSQFKFNKATTNESIEKFLTENDWVLPDDYKEFLLLHNGADFFSHEYGEAFYLYSLEEIKDNYIKELHTNCYPIGRFTDIGYILIDNERCKEERNDYLLLDGNELLDFQCNFKTWLNRIIICQGASYWEWKMPKVIYPN